MRKIPVAFASFPNLKNIVLWMILFLLFPFCVPEPCPLKLLVGHLKFTGKLEFLSGFCYDRKLIRLAACFISRLLEAPFGPATLVGYSAMEGSVFLFIPKRDEL